MEDNNQRLNIDKIVCKKCNEINKIKIISNWNDRSISVSFVCNHERNKQEKLEQVDYCLNCQKNIEDFKGCNELKHEIIKKETLYFYCKKHKKKFDSYCDECKQNLCEECNCSHKDIKSCYEYYFSFSQIDELISIFDEVKNFISLIYSLDCNDKISEEFENYYNAYIYSYNDRLFHANIIYNINLFYNFFKILIQNKLIINGDFSIFEINNVNDETIFYDTNFKNQFNDLLDTKNFNFNNKLELFLLSKRFKIKPELFESFSNKIHSFLSDDILELDDLEKKIFQFLYYFNNFKEGVNNKKFEILKIQNEINYEILSIKLSKIAVPSNLKRKLINIL